MMMMISVVLQKPCCEVTSIDPVPFVYLDETSSLVISSVALSRECGCSRGADPPGPTTVI